MKITITPLEWYILPSKKEITSNFDENSASWDNEVQYKFIFLTLHIYQKFSDGQKVKPQ
jgi:hypothetical protein